MLGTEANSVLHSKTSMHSTPSLKTNKQTKTKTSHSVVFAKSLHLAKPIWFHS